MTTNFGDLIEAELHLLNLMKEKTENVTIYPLNEKGKWERSVGCFVVPGNETSKNIEIRLKQLGISTGNWYGAGEGEDLPQ